MTLLLWLVKASVVVAVAAIVHATCRRTSAAMRHVIWTVGIAGLLLLPVLSFVLPAWSALPQKTIVAALSKGPAFTPSDAIDSPSGSVSHGPRSIAFQWSVVLPSTYAAVVVLLLARSAVQRLAIRRLARRAIEVTRRDWTQLLAECCATVAVRHPVPLLMSGEQAMPAMFGIRRPAIFLPVAADEWPTDRRRAVLLHELAHVVRHDCLLQALATVACAIYWVHPGVWWMARRMRVERELACDDAVLSAGFSAYDYADHLLELAYEVPGHGSPALAIAMANPRHLEGRLLALVDANRHRAVPALATRMAAFALAVVVVAPISAATVTARDGEFAQSPSNDEQISGLWEIRPAASAGFVEMRLCHADQFAVSEIPVRELEGLSVEWLSGAHRPIRLILRRDAGTLTLDGTVGRGNGSGIYAFVTDPRFPTDFASLGFEPPSAAMADRWPGLGSWTHTLALYDIGFEFLDTLRHQEGGKPAWPEFFRTKQIHTQLEAVQSGLERRSVQTSNWC